MFFLCLQVLKAEIGNGKGKENHSDSHILLEFEMVAKYYDCYL